MKKEKNKERRMRWDVLLYIFILVESVSPEDAEWNRLVYAECQKIKWAVTLGIPVEKIVKMIERTQTQTP